MTRLPPSLTPVEPTGRFSDIKKANVLSLAQDGTISFALYGEFPSKLKLMNSYVASKIRQELASKETSFNIELLIPYCSILFIELDVFSEEGISTVETINVHRLPTMLGPTATTSIAYVILYHNN